MQAVIGCDVLRSVRSKDTTVVISVCEFLSDVVFQDFPVEVFLQRPSIVKVFCILIFPIYEFHQVS